MFFHPLFKLIKVYYHRDKRNKKHNLSKQDTYYKKDNNKIKTRVPAIIIVPVRYISKYTTNYESNEPIIKPIKINHHKTVKLYNMCEE